MKAKGDFSGKICVVVGTITDDLRLYEVPALKVSITEVDCHFEFCFTKMLGESFLISILVWLRCF